MPTLVTREEALIRDFLAEHGDIIVKPLDGMGGTSVFRLHRQDYNIGVVIETVTHHGRRTVMAQKFIPEIAKGDKRVLVIDGEAGSLLAGAHSENRRNARQPRGRRHRRCATPVGS